MHRASASRRWCTTCCGRAGSMPDKADVSPRMLYEMARRYDEWPGESYDGLERARRHEGLAQARRLLEPCTGSTRARRTQSLYDEPRSRTPLRRPLGAYFRVNHKDIVAMHTAIAEVGILYATAQVHEGWNQVGETGQIEWTDDDGHPRRPRVRHRRLRRARLLDPELVGADWGYNGFCQISYDDWLANGSDVWVARLGAPDRAAQRASRCRAASASPRRARAATSSATCARTSSASATTALAHRRHVRHVGGRRGRDLRAHCAAQPARADDRLLLYAHGGLDCRGLRDAEGRRPARPLLDAASIRSRSSGRPTSGRR